MTTDTPQKAVLTAIIQYKITNQGNSPTVRWLKDKCGLASTSTVQRYINQLINEGELKRGQNPGRDLIVVGGRWVLL